MKTILMKFAGPLQSWGINSHFESRRTNRFPSKSAVIGMIASALGYRRYEDIKLKGLNDLSFAIRIDQPGSLLRDFQIAESHKPNGDKLRSYVTNRFYLQDAVFVIAISSEDDNLIKEVYDSLLNPYFSLYLGRRSLPINFDYMLGLFEGDAINSLMNMKWQASDFYKSHNSNNLDIWADSNLIDRNDLIVRDTPVSFSQGVKDSKYSNDDRRKYSFRSIGKITVKVNQ
ncbi:type I-E CRISPR-associated protein Cas5/CasD [Nicoliella lavandulae]|uniref:Type I-E CRISPR-associated protein Cas5/CasD n=1 Tax=Nicoliella lavandulae TaxID=3082954 RepID=A0ABU8SMI5_9LACO